MRMGAGDASSNFTRGFRERRGQELTRRNSPDWDDQIDEVEKRPGHATVVAGNLLGSTATLGVGSPRESARAGVHRRNEKEAASCRLIVMRWDGNSNSELRIGLRTRSRLLRTLESGRPTVVNAGRPRETSTSTSTSDASTPKIDADRSRASMFHCRQGLLQIEVGPVALRRAVEASRDHGICVSGRPDPMQYLQGAHGCVGAVRLIDGVIRPRRRTPGIDRLGRAPTASRWSDRRRRLNASPGSHRVRHPRIRTPRAPPVARDQLMAG